MWGRCKVNITVLSPSSSSQKQSLSLFLVTLLNQFKTTLLLVITQIVIPSCHMFVLLTTHQWFCSVTWFLLYEAYNANNITYKLNSPAQIWEKTKESFTVQ